MPLVLKAFAELFAFVAVGVSAAMAQLAAPSVSAGTLTCDVAPGVVLIVNSSKDLPYVLYRTDGTKQACGGRLTGGWLYIGAIRCRVVVCSVTRNAGIIP